MNVINFIIENWDFILLIIAAVVCVVLVVFKGNKSVIMRMLFALVTEAEKEYGGGTGALKLASVLAKIYPKLPTIIKAFVSADRLIEWVEEALIKAKEVWASSVAVAAYIEPAADEDHPE